jgi:hypothetical protein
MKRLAQQYAIWRLVFKNSHRRAMRNALRDCGINPFRLFSGKTGTYNHELNNWNWRT